MKLILNSKTYTLFFTQFDFSISDKHPYHIAVYFFISVVIPIYILHRCQS